MTEPRCELHPAYDADYCPVCGTTIRISERPSADVLEKMTVQITLNVPKEESEEAQAWPDVWDSLSRQIAAMKARGEVIDLPHRNA